MLAITFEMGMSLAVAVMAIAVVPSVTWLVKEVLSLRNGLVALQTKVEGITQDCKRHQEWQAEQQRTLNRVDKNLVRLCAKGDVEYDA